MTIIPFARLVKEMRALQREFFTTKAADRPPDLVFRAKELEKRVDRAVAEVLGAAQPTLFGEEEEPR
jgi:hypothetical protein